MATPLQNSEVQSMREKEGKELFFFFSGVKVSTDEHPKDTIFPRI